MVRRREYFKEHPLKVKNLELKLGVYHQRKKGDSREVPYCDIILEGKVKKTFRCNDIFNDEKRYKVNSIDGIKSIARGFAIRELIPKEYNLTAIAINAEKVARRLGLTGNSNYNQRIRDIVDNPRHTRKKGTYISR